MYKQSSRRFREYDLNFIENEVQGDVTILCLHGQGDFIQRYRNWFELFDAQGLHFIGFDWPGHGLSSGARGDLVDEDVIFSLFQWLEEEVVSSSRTFALFGHSMGGMMGLYWLYFAKRGLLRTPDFTIFNSPLLNPRHRVNALKYGALRALSLWVPELAISTGIDPSFCVHDVSKLAENPDHVSLFHDQVSLRWGLAMTRIAELIKSETLLDQPNRAFVSQGAADRITPESFCLDYLEIHPKNTDITYLSLDGARHEPWMEDGYMKRIAVALKKWL